MSSLSNDDIRRLIGDRHADTTPEWTTGDLYDAIVDGHVVSHHVPLTAARRAVRERIESDHPDMPSRDVVIAELVDGPASLFTGGRTWTLDDAKNARAEIQPAA